MTLYRSDGEVMTEQDWDVPHLKTLTVALNSRTIPDAEVEGRRDQFLWMVNAHHEPVEFSIPAGGHWEVALTSGEPNGLPGQGPPARLTLAGRSFALLHRE